MTGLLQLSGAVADLVYRIDALPEPGAEAMARSFALHAGGGVNAAAAAARAGLPVAYGGGLGTGPFADLVRRALAAEGIPVLLPATPGLDQGTCVVLVDRAGERTFVSRGGAEGELTPALLGLLRPAEYGATLLSGYTLAHAGSGAALAAFVAGLPEATRFVFDPAPVVAQIAADLLGPVLGRTDLLTLNRAEAAALTGETGPGPQLAALWQRCPRAQAIVLRAGAAGAILARRDGAVTEVPGLSVPVRDTTGAGDAHTGALLAALADGAGDSEALHFANAAAALSVTRDGPATAPTEAETRAFLAARGAALAATPAP